MGMVLPHANPAISHAEGSLVMRNTCVPHAKMSRSREVRMTLYGFA